MIQYTILATDSVFREEVQVGVNSSVVPPAVLVMAPVVDKKRLGLLYGCASTGHFDLDFQCHVVAYFLLK
jgi:hypothetical protein